MLREDLIRAIYDLNSDKVNDILKKITDEELNNYEEYDYTLLHQIADIDINELDYFDREENYKIFDALIKRLNSNTINKITDYNASALDLALDSENTLIASSLICYAMDLEIIKRTETANRLDFSDLEDTRLREIKRFYNKVISNNNIIEAIKKNDIERIKSLLKQRNLFYPKDLFFIEDREGKKATEYAKEFIKCLKEK